MEKQEITVGAMGGAKEQKVNPIMKYFKYAHLPPKLRAVSMPICELAKQMNFILSDCPEKSAGLHKLLEAKDCFVRASLEVK